MRKLFGNGARVFFLVPPREGPRVSFLEQSRRTILEKVGRDRM